MLGLVLEVEEEGGVEEAMTVDMVAMVVTIARLPRGVEERKRRWLVSVAR